MSELRWLKSQKIFTCIESTIFFQNALVQEVQKFSNEFHLFLFEKFLFYLVQADSWDAEKNLKARKKKNTL